MLKSGTLRRGPEPLVDPQSLKLKSSVGVFNSHVVVLALLRVVCCLADPLVKHLTMEDPSTAVVWWLTNEAKRVRIN